MADKHSKWQGNACRRSKERWKEAQSSQEVWKSTSNDARWTEVTKELDHREKVIHDKKITWNKSMKETSRRDTDLLKTMENAADEEREEHKDKCALEQPERQSRMEEEEAEEARKLLKKMLKNVDDADARVEKTRARFSQEFEEYMRK